MYPYNCSVVVLGIDECTSSATPAHHQLVAVVQLEDIAADIELDECSLEVLSKVSRADCREAC
jgi:hypothetical protein